MSRSPTKDLGGGRCHAGESKYQIGANSIVLFEQRSIPRKPSQTAQNLNKPKMDEKGAQG